MSCFNCGKRINGEVIHFEGDEEIPVCKSCFYEMSGLAMRDHLTGKKDGKKEFMKAKNPLKIEFEPPIQGNLL